jgi:hypothetical protein
MPYKNKADRNYRKEYDTYQGQPDQIKKRGERNKARAVMAKKGAVHKGDGMDVDHVTPLSKGGSGNTSNLRVKPKSDNRSFSRNSDHTVKKNVSQKK